MVPRLSMVALFLLLIADARAGDKLDPLPGLADSLVGKTMIVKGPDVPFGNLGPSNTLVDLGKLKKVAVRVREEKAGGFGCSGRTRKAGSPARTFCCPMPPSTCSPSGSRRTRTTATRSPAAAPPGRRSATWTEPCATSTRPSAANRGRGIGGGAAATAGEHTSAGSMEKDGKAKKAVQGKSGGSPTEGFLNELNKTNRRYPQCARARQASTLDPP
jgi:hypothetical protein